MKKTSLLVLNLTIAGLLEVETAAAQEATPGSTDDPRTRASPADSRLRLGVEQTLASFQRHDYADVDARDTTIVWGFGAADLAADFRVIDRFEVGLAVGLSGSRWTNAAADGFGGTYEASSTDSVLRLNPRVGYGIPLGSSLALVPRIGAEYMHGTMHYYGDHPGGTADQTYTSRYLALGSGVMLEYRPVPWLFVAPVADFSYRMHTNLDGDSTWFSDQPTQSWWLDWKIAAGARI